MSTPIIGLSKTTLDGYCSFCGKNQDDVMYVVHGPGGNICNGCILEVKGMLDQKLAEGSNDDTATEQGS